MPSSKRNSIHNQYIPARGHIIWIDFGKDAEGHEIAKYRPALVLTETSYNLTNGRLICCPLTTTKPRRIKEAIELSGASGNKSWILPSLVRSVDWKARGAKYYSKVSQSLLDSTVEMLLQFVKHKDNLKNSDVEKKLQQLEFELLFWKDLVRSISYSTPSYYDDSSLSRFRPLYSSEFTTQADINTSSFSLFRVGLFSTSFIAAAAIGYYMGKWNTSDCPTLCRYFLG